MTPKLIHLCWFSNDPYPVEIKVCLDTWKRLLPDYEIKVWDYNSAMNIGIPFITQALENKKWAFAADVVRFYAVWRDGGIYMDSDIFLFRRFDELLELKGFVTVNEKMSEDAQKWGLQAAFFLGEKGNLFCEQMINYYRKTPFVKEDGSFDETISPFLMVPIAESMGYKLTDSHIQKLEGLTVYPTTYLSPRKVWNHADHAIGVHRVYGSWRKRKFMRRLDIKLHHYFYAIRYALLKK